MIIFDTPESMRDWSLAQRAAGRSVGFVPTMGALHEGHGSLMKIAVERDDITVLSIFVNPTQFTPHEDLDQYPRTLETDLAMAQEIGIDAIYAPKPSTMYPDGYSTYVEVEGLSNGLCSRTRPHFFRGVATVVTKLFCAVMPHNAYFGQKDAQQCAIITRMARDLDLGVNVVECPLIREDDGLAMSSRNRYLNDAERQQGLCLSQSLFTALELLQSGERNVDAIINHVKNGMAQVHIDYIELVDALTMEPVTTIDKPIVLAVAAKIGETRLIDNIKFDPAKVPATTLATGVV